MPDDEPPADGETDADADTEPDADPDPDVDGGADSQPDADGETDSESESESGVDTGAKRRTEQPRADSQGDSEAAGAAVTESSPDDRATEPTTNGQTDERDTATPADARTESTPAVDPSQDTDSSGIESAVEEDSSGVGSELEGDSSVTETDSEEDSSAAESDTEGDSSTEDANGADADTDGPMPGVPDPDAVSGDDEIPEDVRKYARFQKMDGAQYDRVNEFLRDRTYITAREWAIARLCSDFRTETGVEMTKIGENLPELIPFMTDTYTPQAVNQARSSFEDKIRKSGATFLYGAMCDFFTAEELDDVMYEATEVAKFLLEVEGVDLSVEEELEAEERISSVMRDVREASKELRAEENLGE